MGPWPDALYLGSKHRPMGGRWEIKLYYDTVMAIHLQMPVAAARTEFSGFDRNHVVRKASDSDYLNMLADPCSHQTS